MSHIQERPVYSGWVFIAPDLVPPEWRDRIQLVALVPLVPEEAERLLSRPGGGPVIASSDVPVVALVAQGLSGTQIAKRLALSPRSVYRKLARLRQLFDVASTAELAAELARRGF